MKSLKRFKTVTELQLCNVLAEGEDSRRRALHRPPFLAQTGEQRHPPYLVRAWVGFRRVSVFALLLLGAYTLLAQETNQIDLLKRQLLQMQDNFERVQREQRRQIEALTKKLEDLTKQQSAETERK